MSNYKPILAITMGDPAGIGPEIAVKNFADKKVYECCRPVLIGSTSVVENSLHFADKPLSVNSIKNIKEAEFQFGKIDLIDIGLDVDSVAYGEVSAAAGNLAFQSVLKAIELAKSGEVDGTVTNPIHKKAINEAGHHFSGHTEIYAHYTGTSKYAMLLADEKIKVIHVSTHVSLRKACDLVKKERILEVIDILNSGLKKLGVENPRIGVAGLNPHSGDDGLFGDEEIKEIIPAVEEAKLEGLDVNGPVPPDTMFALAAGGGFDGCVAMYHDQGHIPFKLAGFQWDEESKSMKSVKGVNITLGLPIVRTSVDHGTAFEIAGKGIASPEALLYAIQYAVKLTNSKKELRIVRMIAIIADDFTGAAEIGGVAIKYGLKAVIETEVNKEVDADLLIIAASTRSLTAEEASSEIKLITNKILDLKPEYIFKKLDSVLRGNIVDELVAQLNVQGLKKAIIVAGNPIFGRAIENGIYTVNGIALAETSFANDPDFPIQSSVVTDIIRSTDISIFSLPANSEIPGVGIVVADVKNLEEMNGWADKIDGQTLIAGGAGFFDVLLSKNYRAIHADDSIYMSLGERTLFIFGSKFPKKSALPMGLKAEETVKVNMPDEIYESNTFDPEILEEWVRQVVCNLLNKKKVIVTVEQDYCSETGTSDRIKRNIAELARLVLQKVALTDLLIEGGATTSEVLKSINIQKLYPTSVAGQGIIQMKTDEYPDMTLTTKPGSYSWPDNVGSK